MHTSLPLEVGKGDGAEFVPSCKCWPFPFKGCCRVSVCLREIDCCCYQRCKISVGFHAHFFASGGRKGMELNLSPSCKCWPFPFKGCCRVSVCCEKSIAVATRDVKISVGFPCTLLCLWR
ncbi:hypothetical protein CEXT_723671 [Caerostris extrusa]|uniref:Uncharacterized protein n=1 Tax=Caerostris extrusa TaxID=172846 RepID=A0AAV4M3P7_CAEEX|nr:hypothetical protein CEXT_723671 [Caerostris extrusa]